MTPITWTTEKRKVSSLIPHAQNPRKISEEQIATLKKSIEKFGFVEIPAINTDGTILAGHQRLKVLAMIGQGESEVDVRVPSRPLTAEEQKEYLVRSNKNTGEWDWDLLQEFFQKDDLMEWGFTDDDLYGRFKTKTKGDDEVPQAPETRRSKPGDVYDLGPHRLMCGDSTNQSHITALIQNNPVGMIFTDPPYNINYKGTGKDTSRTIENDNMEQGAFRQFLIKAFECMALASKDNAPMYCCYASRTHREFEDGLNAAGYEVRNQIIWVKTVAGMGWGDYRWKHEPMFYAVKPGKSPEFFAGRTEWTAWDEMPSDAELLEQIKRHIKKEEDGKSTVWRFSRDTGYVHPTQKPVALVVRAIQNSLKTGGVVLDPFGGSGTTLIAAQKTQRVARLMEFDPSFADVIVQRYVNFCNENDMPWSVIKNGQDISAEYTPEC